MNQEQLFELMPKVVVNEAEVNEKIEENKELIEAGNRFVSPFSINRFLYRKLTDLTNDQKLNFFDHLSDYDCVIDENELYFHQIDIEHFADLLQEHFGLENMYELDNLYISRLLKGEDIAKKVMEINGEKVEFEQILAQFVFTTGGMTMGDTPNLIMMLVAKKALLGTFLAEKNVKKLLNGEKEIYDISVLF